jgi:hypothetical protein
MRSRIEQASRGPTVQPTLTARIDERAVAILDEITSLTYTDGASSTDDVPVHVRAASALRRVGNRLVIVQDDVNVLALRDEDGEVRPMLLPVGPGRRRVFDDSARNKQGKMDLEACVALSDARLVAFGSGSSSARETLVVWRPGEPPRTLRAPLLYSGLRAEVAFSGSELNIEGAVIKDQQLLLFQRGNGARRGDCVPINAIGALSLVEFCAWLDEGASVPRLKTVTRVDLGEIDGVKLGFTDATATPGGQIAILACAEDSPDAIRDGPVLGCRIGMLEQRDLRMIDIVDALGNRITFKLEGIEWRPGSELDFDVVADMDRPAEPARLGRLRIREARCPL